MSIATSVLVRPSALLYWYVLGLSVCAGAAWLCVMVWFSSLAPWLFLGLGLVGVVLVYVLTQRELRGQQKFFRIDINCDGFFVLRRLDVWGREITSTSLSLASPLVLWPRLLLLTLKDEFGEKQRLLILRDSVDVTGFRRLSLALLWLAQAHTQSTQQKNVPGGNF